MNARIFPIIAAAIGLTGAIADVTPRQEQKAWGELKKFYTRGSGGHRLSQRQIRRNRRRQQRFPARR